MTRQAFLVLGMHRSGTSAVARILNLAGAAISDRLLGAQPDNPRGFWESQPIMELHDRALASLGMAWDSIEGIPAAWFETADGEALRAGLRAELHADFPDGETFVMKDPRVCRFLPAWLPVLEELRYRTVGIMPVRNPLEVARSLERRNGFAVAKSLLLWLRHVADAEAGSRSIPRAIVRYGELVEDWRSELAEANRQLGFTCFAFSVLFDEQVARFLSRDERHHVASAADLEAADRRGWAAQAFAALQQLHGPADAATIEAAHQTLDRLRGLLDDAESILDPFLASYRAGLQRAASAEAATNARLAAADARLVATDAQLAATDARLVATDAQLAAADARLASAESDAVQMREALDRRGAELDDLQAVAARTQDELAGEHAARLAAEQRLAEAATQTATLQASLNEAGVTLIRSQEETATERMRRLAVEQQLSEAAARANALRVSLDETHVALARTQEEAAQERSAGEALAGQVASLDLEREQFRRASDEATLEVLRSAAQGQAGIHRRLTSGASRMRQLDRLLGDAQVAPSRWFAEPLRSARNLVRLCRQDYRRRVTLLARSGLFDAAYYSSRIGNPAANLPARFLLHGDLAGERPHPLFDPDWYRLMNPDLPAGVAPLQHYLASGGWELRSPHPLFDARYYLSQWAPGEVSGITPLSHFLEVGGLAGISPHPLFDAFNYLRQRPDVAAAGVNPLLHYLAGPAAAVADPHPLFRNSFYLDHSPEVTGISALEHFVRYGAAEGRPPHPLFDVAFYWRQRPDVRLAGVNALRHFLESGDAEGIDPHPLFSCRHYEAQLSAPGEGRVNPLVHYLRWGHLDSRNPHPSFDSRLYLEAYPDVAASGLNPLLHYVLHGAREGRLRFPEAARSICTALHTTTRPTGPTVERGNTAALSQQPGALAAGATAQTAHPTSTVTGMPRVDQKEHLRPAAVRRR